MQAVAHAALRSVESLTFASERADAAKKLELQIQLFPSLTALRVKADVEYFDLPTSLQCLDVTTPYLTSANRSESVGHKRTFLSTHFPFLVTLRIHDDRSLILDTERAGIQRFLTAHCAQITELKMRLVEACILPITLAAELSRLNWPSLRKLSMSGDHPPLTMVSRASSLEELEIFTACPEELVLSDKGWSALTSFTTYCAVPIDSHFMQRLGSAARLRHFTWQHPGPFPHQYPQWVSRVLSSCRLKRANKWSSVTCPQANHCGRRLRWCTSAAAKRPPPHPRSDRREGNRHLRAERGPPARYACHTSSARAAETAFGAR